MTSTVAATEQGPNLTSKLSPSSLISFTPASSSFSTSSMMLSHLSSKVAVTSLDALANLADMMSYMSTNLMETFMDSAVAMVSMAMAVGVTMGIDMSVGIAMSMGITMSVGVAMATALAVSGGRGMARASRSTGTSDKSIQTSRNHLGNSSGA